MKIHLKSFLSGFFSTLVFHQGILYLLYLLEVRPSPPFNMNPTQPFGVPSVISLAFFGGLWGILIWKLVCSFEGRKHWISTIVLGAIGPTAVAFIIVFPLKGLEVPLSVVPLALLINGAWGFGNSFFMKAVFKK